MSDSTQPTRVQIEFLPYSHHAVNAFLKNVAADFGPPGHKRRWYFTSVTIDDEPSSRGYINDNGWILDFYFADPYDATMFGLKYQR